MKYPKIIATIGPSSFSYNIIKEMSSNGMDIIRINTKYGNIKQYEKIISHAKRARCKILIDINSHKYLDWLNTQDFDYLALAFTQSGKQIKYLRQQLTNKKVKIIAKIENKKGIKNIKDILKECDGMMVARGDLGKNIPLEKLPIFQKELLKKCNKKNKFSITATEMLLSMTKNKIPTRAEASDVANAILDGSNAVMLSEETAIGKHPVICVKMMDGIIKSTWKWEKKLEFSPNIKK
ncbi:hypothetical protein COU57_03715 [Candidatus Pacearchaeota archaeon CG10_big_fil_rev_8_21_14_0_10_32_14]|nr:MAG: hypothetical protein COU57_03715 [Candidatus Pacearchaeota archaeon CG10_big_fil_rev_8_21_14_0_10_32_14]